MQRKQTLGGKKKYLFEPKIPQREALIFNEHTDGSNSAEAPSDAPTVPTVPAKPNCKKTIITTSVVAPCSSTTAPDIANGAQDMVFERENDPKCIGPVDYKTISFYEDNCFIMELPSLENGELLVTDGHACVLTNGIETIEIHPLAGASQLVIEMDGNHITEVGTVTQTYIE